MCTVPLQVERQIDQMVKFIKQEAEEKANEISVSAEEVRCSAVMRPITAPWFGKDSPALMLQIASTDAAADVQPS